MLNDPGAVHDPASFQQGRAEHQLHLQLVLRRLLAHRLLQLGQQPRPRPGRRPRPAGAGLGPRTSWRGFDPTATPADYTPPAEHPNSVDQDYYISWNNKQARLRSRPPASGNGSVHRGNLLDDRVKALLRDGGKVTRSSLTQAMDERGAGRPAGRRMCCPSCCG